MRTVCFLTISHCIQCLGGGGYPLDIPTAEVPCPRGHTWTYPPSWCAMPPRHTHPQDILTPRHTHSRPWKDMGPEIQSLLLWTDRHLWKHDLPATSLAAVKIKSYLNDNDNNTNQMKCFLIQQLIPSLTLRSSKARNNVMFCHQPKAFSRMLFG